MVGATTRPKARSSRSTRPLPSTGIPPVWADDGQIVVQPLFAEEVLIQIQSLGLSQVEAARFFKVTQPALGKVLRGLDHQAWATAPVAEQISILLPRFDVASLARAAHVSKAKVQSALALLVLNFVMLTRRTEH